MSKLNEVHVYGFLKEPVIEYEDETPVACSFMVRTIRRKAGSVLEQYTGSDELIFYTREREKINSMIIAKEKMEKGEESFPIEVYGNIVTRQTEASLKCRKCGEKFDVRIFLTYVRPTAINTLYRRMKQSPFLPMMQEVSNSVNLIGTVTKNPFMLNNKEMTVDENGEKTWSPVDSEETVFPLAITRNYAVLEDLENDTDFPLIAAKTLDTEFDFIQKGSSVLIRGSVWNKTVTRVLPCPHCNHENEFEDSVVLIFPYNVEFLFSAKNRYALGAAMTALDDDMAIHIIQNGETVTKIAKKMYLLDPEYDEARKILYPKLIKRIIPKSEKEIEFEIEENSIDEDREEIAKLEKEMSLLRNELINKSKEVIEEQNKVVEAQAKNKTLKKKIGKMSTDLTYKNEKLKYISKDLTEKNEALDKVSKSLKKKNKEIENKTEKLKKKNKKLTILYKKLSLRGEGDG